MFSCSIARRLTGLVKPKSNNVGVDHAQVEWSKKQIRVGNSKEHGIIAGGITLVNLASRLVSVTRVVTSNSQRSVGKVQLADPGSEQRGAGAGGGDI